MDAAVRRIVERFELEPHPEGGFFREVYRASTRLNHPDIETGQATERAAGTLIYYLLSGSDFSAFHRVRHSDEIWHLYAGGPIEIFVIDKSGQLDRRCLTSDIEHGQPSTVVRADNWQSARLAEGSDWAFGGCSVSPGFDFADFELPSREFLLDCFPHHASTIRELTRK